MFIVLKKKEFLKLSQFGLIEHRIDIILMYDDLPLLSKDSNGANIFSLLISIIWSKLLV